MIVKSVLLPIGVEAAFALFTDRIGQWWPPERRHTGDPASEIHLLESGRFYERGRDGVEVELGRVTLWRPPHRLLLDFYIATGPDRPTEVEIEFRPVGTGAEVVVTHRPKSASRELWPGRAPRYAQSWDLVLAALSRGCG